MWHSFATTSLWGSVWSACVWQQNRKAVKCDSHQNDARQTFPTHSFREEHFKRNRRIYIKVLKKPRFIFYDTVFCFFLLHRTKEEQGELGVKGESLVRCNWSRWTCLVPRGKHHSSSDTLSLVCETKHHQFVILGALKEFLIHQLLLTFFLVKNDIAQGVRRSFLCTVLQMYSSYWKCK